MERTKIEENVKQILVSVLQHDKFEMHDNLSAREVDGWDSLTHMSIITETEKAFNIKFKLKELNKLKNVGALIDLIISKQ